MKTSDLKRYFILAISLIFLRVQAQINVGPKEQVTPKVWNFESGDVDQLKKTTTIFIIGDDDAENISVWDSALRASWTFTELEVKTYTEFTEMESYSGYSFFMVSGYIKVSESSVVSHYYLLLWMPDGKEQKNFARVELYPNFTTRDKMSTLFYDKDKSKPMKYLNGDAFFYNWQPGLVAKSLEEVNRNLTAGTVRWLFASEAKGNLEPLKEQTLYIVDYTLIDHNMRNGDESERLDAAELMDDYPYPYQFISVEELDEMLLNRTGEPFYYLTIVLSNSDKFINVVNSADGEILYSDYQGISLEAKDKDFEKLKKAIDKKKK